MGSISLSDASCEPIIFITENNLPEDADMVPGSDVEPCVWPVVEVDVAIVYACLPTIRPLLDQKVWGNKSQSIEFQSIDPMQKPSLCQENCQLGSFNSGHNVQNIRTSPAATT